MEAALMPLPAGNLRFVGGYQLLEEIGRGSMGVVYRARQLSLDRDVVVKLLQLSDTDEELNELLTKRFRREAQATSRLDHPNTVRVIDFGQTEGGELYLVLEMLRGRSLGALRREVGHLPPARVARIAEQVCRSLAEAHAAGVIHRDLKPDNVFLCDYPDGRSVAKVMDFGVARLLAPTDTHISRITQAGLTVGTPMYIAPEQARGLETTPATDLYSLGVMLYELLSGAPPFDAINGMELAIKHIRQPSPTLEIPGLVGARLLEWRILIEALLAKRPADRPQTAAEVIERLAPLQGTWSDPAAEIVPPRAIASAAEVRETEPWAKSATEDPDDADQAAASPSQAPASPSQAAASPSQAPASPSQAPVAPSQAPASPVAPSQAAAAPSQAPASPSQAPASPSQAPASPSQAAAWPAAASGSSFRAPVALGLVGALGLGFLLGYLVG